MGGEGCWGVLEKVCEEANTYHFTNKSLFFSSSCSRQALIFLIDPRRVGFAETGKPPKPSFPEAFKGTGPQRDGSVTHQGG